MRRSISLAALLVLLLAPAMAWAGGTTVVVGQPASAVPPGECTGFLVCQNFEGTGYDNAESWTEGAGTNDEDYATSPAPLRGTQSLALDSTSSATSSYASFSTVEETWAHALFRVPAAAPAANTSILAVYAGTTVRGQVSYRTDGAWGMLHGSASWNSGATKPTANTTYHLWWHYKPETVPGSSNDGVNELWWGTTVNRAEATSVTQQSNGNGDGSLTRFYANNSTTGNLYIYDQMLLDNAEFTTVAE